MKVLAIVNQDDAGLGLFADVIHGAGAELAECRPPSGDSLPDTADAVIVLGSAVDPDQGADNPWLGIERAWLAGLLAREVPTLGICLGAELLGQAAGGELVRMAGPEIGWIDVELAADASADPLLGALPARFPSFQWHSWSVNPPPGAQVLARSAACAQAYRLGERAWGIQFHAEVSPEIVASWIADAELGDADDVREAAVDLPALRERTARELPAWNELGRGLCERFLALAAERSQHQ